MIKGHFQTIACLQCFDSSIPSRFSTDLACVNHTSFTCPSGSGSGQWSTSWAHRGWQAASSFWIRYADHLHWLFKSILSTWQRFQTSSRIPTRLFLQWVHQALVCLQPFRCPICSEYMFRSRLRMLKKIRPQCNSQTPNSINSHPSSTCRLRKWTMKHQLSAQRLATSKFFLQTVCWSFALVVLKHSKHMAKVPNEQKLTEAVFSQWVQQALLCLQHVLSIYIYIYTYRERCVLLSHGPAVAWLVSWHPVVDPVFSRRCHKALCST